MSTLYEEALERLDRRVHALYRRCEAEYAEVDDVEFVELHGLRVECDPECNRLLRTIRRYVLRHPEAA